MSPVVSVIMPVYNCSEYVHDAIESILGQTFTDFELIIIDDASTDNTKQVVKSFADPRINLIEKSDNSGLSSSLNMGIDIAKGEFIARMDGDDISLPERLQKQVEFLRVNPKVILCGSWFQIIPGNYTIEHPLTDEEIRIAFLDYCAIGHPTVMFNGSLLRSSGLKYNQAIEHAEDYDLWTRMIQHGRMAN